MTNPNSAEAVELAACPLCGQHPKRNGRGKAGGVLCVGDNATVSKIHRFQTYGADQIEADAAWERFARPSPAPSEQSEVGCPIELDSEGEAMVCTGCCTTRTIAHIRYISPGALCCCPERKMIPVRQALVHAALQPHALPDREAVAKVVIGPRNPVPTNSVFSLEHLQEHRWISAREHERAEALWIADAILSLIQKGRV